MNLKITSEMPSDEFKNHLRNINKKYQNISSREDDVYVHSPPPFVNEVLSEEMQLMKWVRIFQVGIFPRGIFL